MQEVASPATLSEYVNRRWPPLPRHLALEVENYIDWLLQLLVLPACTTFGALSTHLQSHLDDTVRAVHRLGGAWRVGSSRVFLHVRAEAWVAKMNAEASAKAEEKRQKEEEEAAKKKAAEEAAAERKKLFRTKSQLMAEEEEERRKERARRQEEEFGCAIAGGFEKGDYVIAQNNMSVQGEIIVKKGTRGIVRGPSETDPQNRVSVAFDKREKAGYAQINVVHFEIKVTDKPLQKDPNVSELIEKIMTPRDARSKQVVNELEED
eukprot:symbB.v1.2.031907.t1/scaffold3756.1/size50862/1